MYAGRLLIEDKHVVGSLERIVEYLAQDPSTRDDLIQEGLIHLWLAQRQRPGQSTSWYLQGCRFHLQHCLGAGRSVDSHKRRGQRVSEEVNADALSDLSAPET